MRRWHHLLPLILVVVGFVIRVQAATLPTSEDIDGILKGCGGGISQSIQGAVKGKISIWSREAQASGKASVDTLGGILSRLPEGQQINPEIYHEFVGCIENIISQYLKKSADSFTGTLIPGHDPSPSGFSCPVVPGALGVYFGAGLATVATRFPNTAIKILDKDILVINRNDDKEISVDLYIYSDDGRPIATIIRNRFELNEHNFLRMELTADRTNLVVYNLKNEQMLNIKYLNEAAVLMTGTIRYGNHAVVVTDKTANIGEGSFSGGSCMEGAAAADICIQCS